MRNLSLSTKQLLKAYHQAKENQLNKAFIDILYKEIQARQLLRNKKGSK